MSISQEISVGRRPPLSATCAAAAGCSQGSSAEWAEDMPRQTHAGATPVCTKAYAYNQRMHTELYTICLTYGRYLHQLDLPQKFCLGGAPLRSNVMWGCLSHLGNARNTEIPVSINCGPAGCFNLLFGVYIRTPIVGDFQVSSCFMCLTRPGWRPT